MIPSDYYQYASLVCTPPSPAPPRTAPPSPVPPRTAPPPSLAPRTAPPPSLAPRTAPPPSLAPRTAPPAPSYPFPAMTAPHPLMCPSYPFPSSPAPYILCAVYPNPSTCQAILTPLSMHYSNPPQRLHQEMALHPQEVQQRPLAVLEYAQAQQRPLPTERHPPGEATKKRKSRSQDPERNKKAKKAKKCNFPAGVAIQIAAAVLYIADLLGWLSTGDNDWTTTLKAQLYLLFCCFCYSKPETSKLKTIDYVMRFYTEEKKYKKLGVSREEEKLVVQRVKTPAILWEYEGLSRVFRELSGDGRGRFLKRIEKKNNKGKKGKLVEEKKRIREEVERLLCGPTSVFDAWKVELIENIWKAKESQAKEETPAEESQAKDCQAKEETQAEESQAKDLPAADSQGRDSQGAAVVSGSESGVPEEPPIESAVSHLSTLKNNDEVQRYGNILLARLLAYKKVVEELMSQYPPSAAGSSPSPSPNIPPYPVVFQTQQDEVPADGDPLKQWSDSPIPTSPSWLYQS